MRSIKVALVAVATTLALANPVGASKVVNRPPKHDPNITVVADGVKSCDLPHLTAWFRYSNGKTWTFTTTLYGNGEFIWSTDPSDKTRALPKSILVNYTGSICVTDEF